MKLLTQELIKEFEAQGFTDGRDTDKVRIIAKFFYPAGSHVWYAVEWLPEDGVFFGFVSLFGNPQNGDELGYFALSELEEFKGQLGLGIERDIHFGTTHYLSEVLNGSRP
jgi:hypothetical protein